MGGSGRVYAVTGSEQAERSRDERSADVRRAIEQLRQKLLDLTPRNRLLAFRHSRSNSLRIVDELPDQMFKGLLADGSFTLTPVPAPGEEQLRGFYAATAGEGDEPSADGALQPPPAAEWARHVGIATNLELPEAGSTPQQDKHADGLLQTLLYPDDLERRARKLAGDARTAIEESGVNMFHLALGFLEWIDPRSPERPHLAPLILVPAEIRRTRERGRYVYRVSWSGKDLQENLSLAES